MAGGQAGRLVPRLAGERRPGSLLVRLADAVQAIVPAAGERLRQRARLGETPESAVRPLAELLAEDLGDWPEEAWLAIDDYHVVAESAPVEEFVDWLLALSPLRLLVTTRRRPTWVSARRVLYGEITELTRDELAMTAEEGRLVLGDGRGEAVAQLVEQAQGWPALIGLAGLSASFSMPTARISEALFQYFAEEVLRNEPGDIQEFMLAAAVPPAVDVRAASEVLGLANAEEGIRRLEERDSSIQVSAAPADSIRSYATSSEGGSPRRTPPGGRPGRSRPRGCPSRRALGRGVRARAHQSRGRGCSRRRRPRASRGRSDRDRGALARRVRRRRAQAACGRTGAG